ncbi:MAG: asparagine synthase [Prolixibacteraceae bacterium]|nr:MAG: asparagine synthase [Prolixibacteraceae bacterium]
MCGIFGYVSFNKTKVDKIRFDKSLMTMLHRGPNFQKSLLFNNDTIALGHVRLSIIDLSNEANQPMSVDKYQITFNGEIYNYIELREELIKNGYSFCTNSDTEVIVKAFEYWGEDCVHRFNGMWAFAIFDTAENSLFCSRDRFGVKPFNYFIDKERFIFSSEIKAIIHYDDSLRIPNYNSIGLFSREGICGEIPETWFDKILRLLPGHNLIVNKNIITITKYYHYPTKTEDISFEDAKAKFAEIFIDAVKLRMRSDVPVGTTLSGGLDSTSIVAGIRQFNNEIHHTFTAHFPNFKDDEYSTAKKTNQYFQLDGNQVNINYGDDYLTVLNQMIYHLESGHLSPSIFPLWKVYEAAKKNVTVVLEGQGADELLAGYIVEFAGFYLLDKLLKGEIQTFLKNYKVIAKQYSSKAILISFLRLKLPSFVKKIIRKYVLKYEKVLIGKLKKYEYTFQPVCTSDSHLGKILRESHQTTLVNLLHYGDAISMAFSIESRLPFMDYRLVDFSMTLPEDYLIAEGKGKFIQREALRKIFPEYINEDSRKLGFPSPIADFFDGNKSLLEGVLLDKRTLERGIFNEKQLKKMIGSDFHSRFEPGRFIFRLLCVELWFRTFIDKE